MSFQEKSAWLMLVAVVLVYGWYFLTLGQAVFWQEAAVADIAWRGQMFRTVVALVTIAVVAHIIVAAVAPGEVDQSDERDRMISRIGESIGGGIAAAAALMGMGMAMWEMEHFWIANAILLGLVVSELVSGGTKVYLYRRGL